VFFVQFLVVVIVTLTAVMAMGCELLLRLHTHTVIRAYRLVLNGFCRGFPDVVLVFVVVLLPQLFLIAIVGKLLRWDEDEDEDEDK
jgi:hypothetical protein